MSFDKRAIKDFFHLLFLNYSNTEGSDLEIRFINNEKEIVSKFYGIPLNENNLDTKEIAIKNHQGYNIYFGVNPRPASQRKKQEDIKDIICLWLDIDSKNFEGGKEEAKQRTFEFLLTPNIIVDSGNGYHCYWILEEPIIDRTDEDSTELKQILSGLAIALGADKQAINLDRVMRLPGTLNIKNLNNPKECRVVQINQDYFYSLGDFEQFKDYQYPEAVEEELAAEKFDFGTKEFIICNNNTIKALKDVDKLKVSDKVKQMMKTGALQTEYRKDNTRSGRDMAIITALIGAGYKYKTVKGVFLNPLLACSDRMLKRGERQLKFEVKKVLKYLSKDKPASLQIQTIQNIKGLEGNAEEKLKLISKYVVGDLLAGEKSVGVGYKNQAQKAFYFFDRTEKRLMDIEKTDFHCYLKNRFELSKKDFDEVMDWIQMEIWMKGREIEASNFSFFDKERFCLYISDHKNRIYRLDGSRIDLVDNGTDGVIFEFNSNYTPFHLDPSKLKGVNYFENGFDWDRFISGESYLHRYLVTRTNFAKEERYSLSPIEQQYLLVIYFYSIFFESIQKEKPILCLVGVKDSGKTFIGTTIGQILFGELFMPTHLSDSPRDFKTALAENYFVIFDNLDTNVNSFLDSFCVAATGGEITFRKLYTNMEEIRIRPRIFMAFTSRDPHFRRDDLVDRLLLLKTEIIKNRRGKSDLLDELKANREKILAEVLTNLNSIVRLIKQNRYIKSPCIFRIADFETFGRKIHDDKGEMCFVSLLEKMNKVKGEFSLEDDEVYIILKHICIDKSERIEQINGNELYSKLKSVAEEELSFKTFSRKYKSARSLCRRLANIREELSVEFDVYMEKGRANLVYYSFSKKED